MIRYVCLWSPMAVLFVWAGIAALGLDTRFTTTVGRLLLGVTLTLHMYQEFCDRKA